MRSNLRVLCASSTVPNIYCLLNVPFHVVSGLFNSARPRWKNINIPYPGSIVQIIGTCSHMALNGSLAIDIENIILNVPNSTAAADSSGGDGDEGVPVKKRKFKAITTTSMSVVPKFAHSLLPIPV